MSKRAKDPYAPATDLQLLGWVDEIHKMPLLETVTATLPLPCQGKFYLPGLTFNCQLREHGPKMLHLHREERPGKGPWTFQWQD